MHVTNIINYVKTGLLCDLIIMYHIIIVRNFLQVKISGYTVYDQYTTPSVSCRKDIFFVCLG